MSFRSETYFLWRLSRQATSGHQYCLVPRNASAGARYTTNLSFTGRSKRHIFTLKKNYFCTINKLTLLPSGVTPTINWSVTVYFVLHTFSEILTWYGYCCGVRLMFFGRTLPVCLTTTMLTHMPLYLVFPTTFQQQCRYVYFCTCIHQ